MNYREMAGKVFHPFLLARLEKFGLEQPNKGEVHAWSTSLEADENTLRSLSNNLSTDELFRANRFNSGLHRRRFIVARSTLRILISRYLNCEISSIELITDAKGKPSVKKPTTELTFNVSHSHELALYGFGSSRAIGIDVERVRTDVSELAIAKRFFSTDEIEKIENLSEKDRRKGFFSCWTRKEAYLKARGVGIGGGLKSFSVTCGYDEEVRLIKGAGVENWEMLALIPDSKYTAAICVEGKGFEISCRRLKQE